MERDFKGVWIPREIWLDKNLSLLEKCFLVEIDSLDNEDGCFASNAHFADFSQLSKNRCSEVIKSLKDKGYITSHLIKKDGKKNVVRRVLKGIRKIDRPIREIEGGYSENGEGNNTCISNTYKVNIVEIIHYLNLKTGKEFRTNSDATKKMIVARLNESFTVNDFRRVIDTKTNDWLGSDMACYLRPSTLFSKKHFEEYLNEAPKELKKKESDYEYF